MGATTSLLPRELSTDDVDDTVAERDLELVGSGPMDGCETESIGLETDPFVGGDWVGEGKMVTERAVVTGNTLVETSATKESTKEVTAAGLSGGEKDEELEVGNACEALGTVVTMVDADAPKVVGEG